MIDNENKVHVIDRAKNVVVLANGKTYCPTKLECIFESHAFVDQICITNKTGKNSLIAITSVNNSAIWDWATKNSIPITNMETLLKSPEVAKIVLAEFKELGVTHALQDHEIPQAVIFTDEEWTTENFLTVSFKVLRSKVIAHFAEMINCF